MNGTLSYLYVLRTKTAFPADGAVVISEVAVVVSGAWSLHSKSSHGQPALQFSWNILLNHSVWSILYDINVKDLKYSLHKDSSIVLSRTGQYIDLCIPCYHRIRKHNDPSWFHSRQGICSIQHLLRKSKIFKSSSSTDPLKLKELILTSHWQTELSQSTQPSRQLTSHGQSEFNRFNSKLGTP